MVGWVIPGKDTCSQKQRCIFRNYQQ